MPVEVGIAKFVHSDKPYIPSYLPYLVGLKMYLEKNADRNMFIFSYIVKLAAKKMVVLSDRITQLDFLAAQYRREFPDKKVCRMYGAKKLTKKQRAQGMKQEIIPTPTQIEMDSADILFATYQKASLGLNVETLEGLILAMPFSSKVMLEQTIGRVQRLMQGKEPFVVDFADKGIRMLEGMADKRYTMYRKWGYKVDYF
jgi:superfamily II DNA or RNA helicase